jgi:hypothetical protein
MYDKFPLTFAALEELELESSGGQCPSCSACWAVGDALLEECGDDPVWDWEMAESFKGGLKLEGQRIGFLSMELRDVLLSICALSRSCASLAATYPADERDLCCTRRKYG